MNAFKPAIDWAQPWLQDWRGLGQPVAQRCAAGLPVSEALNPTVSAPVAPVVFVPQHQLPAGIAYESYIFSTGQCPTRNNLHDFFNGLAWLRFPLSKRRLNALQAAQIQAHGILPVRGAVRDALTLFDENAAILMAPEPIWQALAARQWQRLYVTLRPLWAQAQLILFGHALLEKLVFPRKNMVAHVYRAHNAPKNMADLDAWLAADLTADKLAKKPFIPLPVLGIPGWWPDNENFSFYDDASVFRM